MKRAPHVQNHSPSSTLHRLRTNRHAQIKISKRQKPMAPTGRDANRPKTRKTHTASARTNPEHPACTVRSKAPELLKSP